MDLEQKFLTPRLTVILALGLVAAAVLAFVFARHDLALSEAARALPDAHADYSFWWLVNYYGEIPTWMVIALAALGCLGSLAVSKGRMALARFRPHLLFVICTAALGPGLLNQGMKALFNRPRPGDGLGFLPVFVIGPAHHDNSFPSGHTAMAFVLLALVFLVPRTKTGLRALAGTGFVLWGIAVGAARVVYGAHYPSDVLFGAGVTLIVEIILWGAVFRRRIVPPDLT
jgi:membrane-associated phospholipid phosphatase